MTPAALRHLVAQGEGPTLDFKRSTGELSRGTRAGLTLRACRDMRIRGCSLCRLESNTAPRSLGGPANFAALEEPITLRALQAELKRLHEAGFVVVIGKGRATVYHAARATLELQADRRFMCSDRGDMTMTRVVYSTDVHGNLNLFQAVGEAAERWGADAVVFGGDLCPEAHPFDRMPQTQPEFLRRHVAPLLETWKQARPTLRVLVIPGNDDFQTIVPALDTLEQDGLIENLHRKATKLGAYTFVGLAFVPPTPFSIKDFERRDLAQPAGQQMEFFRGVVSSPHGVQELPDLRMYLDSHPSIEEELDRLDALLQDEPQNLIGVIHCPPKNTRCDVLSTGQRIGSKAVRRWIEQRQPLLTLHGHIHESPRMSKAFADRIGVTHVVNPGSDKQDLHLVFVELEHLETMTHSIFGRQRAQEPGF